MSFYVGCTPLVTVLQNWESPQKEIAEMEQERCPGWEVALPLSVNFQSKSVRCFISGFSFVGHLSKYKWVLKLSLLTLGSVGGDCGRFHWPRHGILTLCFQGVPFGFWGKKKRKKILLFISLQFELNIHGHCYSTLNYLLSLLSLLSHCRTTSFKIKLKLLWLANALEYHNLIYRIL